MKRYLGSKITLFAAIASMLFIIAPIIFTMIVLVSEISVATILLSLLFMSCSIICGVNVSKIAEQLYTVGRFHGTGIDIKSLGCKTYTVEYNTLSSIGIGYYYHGFQNPNAGIKVFFLFFSIEMFDEQYRTKINLWKPSSQRLKVEFDIDLYNYLMQVLPQKQALMLKNDFKMYFQK